jgi:uncharacterized protein (DUF736 family)
MRFTIKANKFKKNDKQPDYRVSIMEGKAWKDDAGACWLKEDKNGNKYFSCLIQEEKDNISDTWVKPDEKPDYPF